jgi:hypothetical protein
MCLYCISYAWAFGIVYGIDEEVVRAAAEGDLQRAKTLWEVVDHILDVSEQEFFRHVRRGKTPTQMTQAEYAARLALQFIRDKPAMAGINFRSWVGLPPAQARDEALARSEALGRAYAVLCGVPPAKPDPPGSEARASHFRGLIARAAAGKTWAVSQAESGIAIAEVLIEILSTEGFTEKDLNLSLPPRALA